ncbi:hypothetical protein GMOD_00006406 [Pyrenophora seminiperda CCB06]|uniref:Uncharacterized protein n=1 Tax=Pyrenophora seminiperda CCB06 TaxID=1302712 RepID=A0A3M7M4Y6_9PLEO|nr:hypothetical protein GMOD_00006406 [Pyrenophora seminiperda CCB06]
MQALAGSRPKVGNERRSAYAADARHEPVVKRRRLVQAPWSFAAVSAGSVVADLAAF